MATRKNRAAEALPGSFALAHWMSRLNVTDEQLADKVMAA
jgi:hypothetical protein